MQVDVGGGTAARIGIADADGEGTGGIGHAIGGELRCGIEGSLKWSGAQEDLRAVYEFAAGYSECKVARSNASGSDPTEDRCGIQKTDITGPAGGGRCGAGGADRNGIGTGKHSGRGVAAVHGNGSEGRGTAGGSVDRPSHSCVCCA